jgi:hypothetical protein
MVVVQMEYHVAKDVLWVNPWPKLKGRAEYLSDAQHYATQQTGVSGDDVFTTKFLDTVSSSMLSYPGIYIYTHG